MKSIIFLITLFTSFFAYSQNVITYDGLETIDARGTVHRTLDVRKAPPHGLFNLFVGSKFYEAEVGEEVSITGKISYYGLTGEHVWYQIDKIGAEKVNSQSGAWVYGGEKGAYIVTIDDKR